MQRNRASLSREEQELMDVERQMEEQLVQQHMELERVVAIRPEPMTEGGVGYLCKWRGLPYAEATWENKQMIQSIDNGHAMTEAYQACAPPSHAVLTFHHPWPTPENCSGILGLDLGIMQSGFPGG